MDDAENEIARQLGGGVKAHGVRLALRAARMVGIEETLAAASTYPGGTAGAGDASPGQEVVHE